MNVTLKMSISVLDKNTASLLTTTQIVTSVYAVVKELFENALDAGAKCIEISLVDNGVTSIEVKDDGHGISMENALRMALPSTTSKISSFTDLESLKTYGFRGEALNALCQAADVNVSTKTKDDEAATLYTFDHLGNVVNTCFVHRSTGTTVTVNRLFKDLPVRRQIANDKQTISREIKRLDYLLKCFAVCHPSLRIMFRVNDNVTWMKHAVNTTKEALAFVIGKKIVSNLDWIENKSDQVQLQLMVPKKQEVESLEICFSGQPMISVNNRPVSYKVFEKVMNERISQYFENLLKERTRIREILFYLNIHVPASDLDINLEPNKTRVFLKNEKLKEILTEYYEIHEEQKSSTDTTCNSSNGYLDDTVYENETEDEIGVQCKKRKIESEELEHQVSLYRKSERVKRVSHELTNAHRRHSTDNKERNFAKSSNDSAILQTEKDNRVLTESMKNYLKIADRPCNPNDKSNLTSDISTICDTDSTDTDEQHFIHPTPEELSMDLVNDEWPELAQNVTEADQVLHSQSTSSQVDSEISDKENLVCDASTNFHHKDNELSIFDPEATIEKFKGRDNFDELWSKGQIPGLIGGTAVQILGTTKASAISNEQNVHDRSSNEGNDKCKGFHRFAKETRVQIMKENPGLSAAEVAKMLAAKWKAISSEERGYYRDSVVKENERLDTSRKSQKKSEASKTKNTLLKIFEKMKKEKPVLEKEGYLKRTTVLWTIDISRLKEKASKPMSKQPYTVIGPLNSKIWLIRAGSQIWATDVELLYKRLNPGEPSPDETINIETLDQLLTKWLVGSDDDASFLHPVYHLTKKEKS
ncbi:PMS1 protein homolog 1 isoform X2 [Orussus abietinus]|uniref:PMS1 protein homolog 1 isoform X2 n=1 Tax=Orussus abietinus TaxID=222816 RepID=UPI000625F421|nr:PMS1 protein homolog 1 isoform X2 [Orussus abietinus]